jgi:Tetratricopeptide repeat
LTPTDRFETAPESAAGGLDSAAGLGWSKIGTEQSRARSFDWALGIALTIDGMLQATAGDGETARAGYAEALELQERLGDYEGAGMSLGGLAQLAAGGGDAAAALDLYRRSLAAFEAVGDRGEEARILSEIAWTHLTNGTPRSRGGTSSVRSGRIRKSPASAGWGISLTGLAAAEAVDKRPERAVQIAAAAEVYAKEEGIVVVYSDETPGRELVEEAQAALSAEDPALAREAGRRLTIKEALDLARPGQPVVV